MCLDTPSSLRERARRFREISRTVTDGRSIVALLTLADEYDAYALRLEQSERGSAGPEPKN